jgi:hypothetical protein
LENNKDELEESISQDNDLESVSDENKVEEGEDSAGSNKSMDEENICPVETYDPMIDF